MGLLTQHKFEPVYFKNRHEVFSEFYKPCMENSIRYDRVSGYFGSSVFVVINDALKDFINKDGHIRIICSPVLTDADYDAIKNGYSRKLSNVAIQSLNSIFDEMMVDYPKTSELLSNLITLGFLEIKLAVYGNNPKAYRLVHDKIGIFTDIEDNSLCFRGSINETFKGVSTFGNSESFDVDCSWGENIERIRVDLAKEQFENIWIGAENEITTFDIPDVTLEKIRSVKTEKNINELFEEVRIEINILSSESVTFNLPYTDFVIFEKIDLSKYTISETLKFEVLDNKVFRIDNNNFLVAINYGKTKLIVSDQNNNQNREISIEVVNWGAEPGINRRKTRDYQETILNNWTSNNRIGLLEMATGSGKTFTAMCAIRNSIYMHNEIPLIVVPRKILFNQWKDEIEKTFGNEVNLLLFGNDNNDINSLKIMSYPSKVKTIILATLQTASKKEFISTINHGNHLFLVVDEVHNVGSSKYSKLLNLNTGPRMGLSATPKRYRDPVGTKKIYDYFIKSIEPKYTLIDAIKDKSLCEYFYYPKQIELEEDESLEYLSLSKVISKRYAILKGQNLSEKEIFEDVQIKMSLIKRSDIIKKANNKISLVKDILTDKYNRGDRWLLYCDDVEQLTKVKNVVKKIEKIYPSDLYEYHAESDVREETLRNYENLGGVLLSINCLDEGVDIPSISHAIILSSSQNERQYIQRRGRVLRQSPNTNKEFSYIYDAVVSPNSIDYSGEEYPFLHYEIKRAKVFAENAINSIDALSKLEIIKIKNLHEIVDEGEEEYE